MSETLRQKQSRFVRYIGLLIEFAYQNGYELTFADGARSDEQAEINALGHAGRSRLVRELAKFVEFTQLARCISNNTGSGIRTSLHNERLAQDFNLFKNGHYLASTEAHRQLGEYWEGLAPDCRWGGRFGDGNHYSLEHQGRK